MPDRYFMVATRPGPNHIFYKHKDYGITENAGGIAWTVRLVGPQGGEGWNHEADEYNYITRMRKADYEVQVTELPVEWTEPPAPRYRAVAATIGGGYTVLDGSRLVGLNLPEDIARDLVEKLNAREG